MATLNLQVAASGLILEGQNITSDVGRAVTANLGAAEPNPSLGPGSHSGNGERSYLIRFTNVTIDQAATVSSALFKLTCWETYNAGANVVKFFVSAHASDNSGALVQADDNMNTTNRPRTTATTIHTANSVVLDTVYDIDITAVIQEIVNRAGWTSGSAITIITDCHPDTTTGEWQSYWSYLGSSSKAPKLDVDYTAGGGAALPFRQTKAAQAVNRASYY